MCCLSETFTGVYFTEALARTTHATMHAAIESLLEDEIDHGKVGWTYLAARSRDGATNGLAAALPAMLTRVVGRVMHVAGRAPAPDALALEAFGPLGAQATAAIFARTLRDVILPGFELVGIDLVPARACIEESGWLA